MNFAANPLKTEAPTKIADIHLPNDNIPQNDIELRKIGGYTPSPVDWREELLYFLLVDRFSDEKDRPLLNRDNLEAARPAMGGHDTWQWDAWAKSGAFRYQGGNLKGIIKRMDYLKKLGITAIWLSPIFKQRAHEDSYHGYGIQNFLEIEPRFGTREDLIELVNAAHKNGIRIILDVIFNHSGHNWDYYLDGKTVAEPAYIECETKDCDDKHCGCGKEPYKADTVKWLDEKGQPTSLHYFGIDEAVWPLELQNPGYYTRRGKGSLDAGDIDDPHAQHKLTDFYSLRDFNLDNDVALENITRCYKYWIELADIDGFRIDTLKHIEKEHARKICGTIKEFAARLGKTNFLLMAEVAGGDTAQDIYLDAVTRNLDAVLDIGETRLALRRLAKGMDADAARDYFSNFEVDEKNRELMPSHRALGKRHISILDDHDHVFGEKIRFSYGTPKHQILAGVALQMFTLGIPCIYYGTEQEFRGPEPENIKYLMGENGWNDGGNWGDRYLREAMFGPEHPLKSGLRGRDSQYDEDRYADVCDPNQDCLPGFGPFGTAGYHCFDESYYVYKKIAEMAAVRKTYTSLRYGRQYHRPVSYLSYKFDTNTEGGQIVAWSRIIDWEEMVCVLNSNGNESRGARIVVDKALNKVGRKMKLVLNTTNQSYPEYLEVKETGDYHYIEVDELEPSGFLIYTNVKTPIH